MRIVRIFSILVGAFLSLSFGSAHAGNIREGRYIGQYACGHVLYKATLEVFDGGTGRFSFTGRQNGVSGAYRVTILSMGNNAMMRPAQWESQPPGFSMVGASLLPFGDRLTGRMDDSACTSLQLVFDNSAGNGQTANAANAPGFATNTGVPGRSQNRPDTNGYTPPQVAAPTANSGFDCISQRAKVIKTYLNSTEGRDTTERANAFVTRPDLNEAYSQASVCAKQVTQDARARLLNAIPDNASAADLAIISPQVARIQADFAASYNDFQTLSSAKALISGWIRGPRDQKERYAAEQARLRALTYPGAPMENVFSTKDAPKLTAFYTSVAKAVSQTNDEAVLSRMARDLLPFYNGEAGMNGASIDIKDQDGYGRTQAMGGYDIYAVTLAHPSAENLMKLIVAQADPLQRPQVIAEYNRRKAMPGPKAGELALMLSRSFYRAQPDYLQLEKAGTIRQGSYGTYGAWVVWEIPSVMGSMSMHSERYYFFVNDLPGPLCTKKPAGYECKMQIYIDRDIQDLQGQVAASIFGSMTGTNYDPDAFTKKTKTNYDGRTFEWTDITLTVTGQASGWRSTVVDQFMTEFARKEEAQRLAAARARNATPPPDPNRQLCNSIAAGAVASMNFSATNSLSYQMMC